MIWYNNIDAVTVIQQGIADDFHGTRHVTTRKGRMGRGMRLVERVDHATH